MTCVHMRGVRVQTEEVPRWQTCGKRPSVSACDCMCELCCSLDLFADQWSDIFRSDDVFFFYLRAELRGRRVRMLVLIGTVKLSIIKVWHTKQSQGTSITPLSYHLFLHICIYLHRSLMMLDFKVNYKVTCQTSGSATQRMYLPKILLILCTSNQ